MELTSVSSGKRVEKTADNEFGWQHVVSVPKDEVCVVMLGGNGTNSDQRANGYAKSYQALLENANIKDVPIYVAIYHNQKDEQIPSLVYAMQKASRESLLEKFGRDRKRELIPQEQEMINKIEALRGKDVLDKNNKEISNPAYIEDLFDKLLLERISENGKRISQEEAMERIGKLNIVAHCHGAYLFLKLEEMMQEKMSALGYTEEEKNNIQKQLLCVAHSPYCPLGVSKSKMISFGSASDDEVWHQNSFHQQLKTLNKDGKLKLSYFTERKGECFVVSNITEINHDENIPHSMTEHGFIDFINPKQKLTREGQALMRMEGNVVINGVKSSLKREKLPETKDLVCGQDEVGRKLFEAIRKNGEEAYKVMVENARVQERILHDKSRNE